MAQEADIKEEETAETAPESMAEEVSVIKDDAAQKEAGDEEKQEEALSPIEEGEIELEFDVNMSSGILYDYLLRHSYSSAVGLLGSCFGAFGIIMFAMSMSWLYLIMGLIVLLYLPVTLFKRSKIVMLTNPSFKKPLHYRFYEKGFTVSQDDAKSVMEWGGCTKAVSTKKSIIIYTGKNNASIFPREQIPGGAADLISLIAKHMEPKKVKIRY